MNINKYHNNMKIIAVIKAYKISRIVKFRYELLLSTNSCSFPISVFD